MSLQIAGQLPPPSPSGKGAPCGRTWACRPAPATSSPLSALGLVCFPLFSPPCHQPSFSLDKGLPRQTVTNSKAASGHLPSHTPSFSGSGVEAVPRVWGAMHGEPRAAGACPDGVLEVHCGKRTPPLERGRQAESRTGCSCLSCWPPRDTDGLMGSVHPRARCLPWVSSAGWGGGWRRAMLAVPAGALLP